MHHVVRDVHDVRDRAHSREIEARPQPLRRGADLDVRERATDVARAAAEVLDRDLGRLVRDERWILRVGRTELAAAERGDLPCDPDHGEKVGTVHGRRHVEDAVDKVLRRAPAEALEAEAIERAKTRLVAETVYSSDSQSSLARIYGSALAIGETVEEVRRWPIDIEAVTQARLAAAAERWLAPARSVTGYLTKAKDADAPVAIAAE